MAYTKRNEAQRQSPVSIDPPREEIFTPGHASLRRECWSGSLGTVSGRSCGATASPPPVIRHRLAPPRKGAPHPHRRPLQGAAARFISNDCEILAD